MTPITVSFEPDDYLSAGRLHLAGGTRRMVVGAAAGAAIAVAALMVYEGPSKFEASNLLLAALVVGAAALLVALLNGFRMLAVLPRRTRRIVQQQKNLHRPFDLWWDADTIFTKSANGDARIPWSDYLKWRENGRLFLLYRSDVLFQMFPKRAFPAAQIDEFRALARAKIAPAAGRRRAS